LINKRIDMAIGQSATRVTILWSIAVVGADMPIAVVKSLLETAVSGYFTDVFDNTVYDKTV